MTGTSISINRVADMIMKETGNKVDKIFKKLELGDPEKSSGSVSKIKQYFYIIIRYVKNTTLHPHSPDH